MDSYCCEESWDKKCTLECVLYCGGCGLLENCGDGTCTGAEGENCINCPGDCPCEAGFVCTAVDCAPDLCELSVGPEGCCDGAVLNKCIEGQLTAVDCAVAGAMCGWAYQTDDKPAGYYCGDTGDVNPFGDPQGNHPLECPTVCAVHCEGKECGSDGCGGTCGQCPGAQGVCVQGKCACQPDCSGKSCGPDGCDRDCGPCNPGETCLEGVCVPPSAQPEPEARIVDGTGFDAHAVDAPDTGAEPSSPNPGAGSGCLTCAQPPAGSDALLLLLLLAVLFGLRWASLPVDPFCLAARVDNLKLS